VTAVCSTANLDKARALGADHVIDYTREDFTRQARRYDLILGANGYHRISDYKRALKPEGTYVMSGGSPAQMFQALIFGPWMSRKGGRKMGALSSRPNLRDLQLIGELLEAGSVVPAIDRTYPLAELPEAFRYLGKGHAKGKVVIACG